MQKEMFKVISPMEKHNGETYWMRCGTGFRNKDASINLYINALPVTPKGKELTLQIREMTEEDLAPKSSTRAAFQLPRTPTNLGPEMAAGSDTPF